MTLKFYLTILLIFNLSFRALGAFESYTIDFQGIESEEILNTIKSVSQLISLQDIPPVSDASLKRRAEADISNIIKALHSLSYYNATVDLKIDFDKNPVHILFTVDPCESYPFAKFTLVKAKNTISAFPLETITLKDLGIALNKKALPKDILKAEEEILSLLEQAGYPLSFIEKREVIVDQKDKSVSVTLFVDIGPFCGFGDVNIYGNKRVKKAFIIKKLKWQRGQTYDPGKLELTQNALEQTGLFNSISIERGSAADDGSLPIDIHVHEAKHRSIGAGISYATERGFGLGADWEHRNFRNMGEKLSLKTNLWAETQAGTLLYLIPDFQTAGRDLRLMLDYEHQRTKGYSEIFYSFSAIIERQINEQIRLSYGGMYKQLHDTRSDNNRDFNLIKSPFQFRFNNTNSLLDPTDGFSVNLKVIPSVQIFRPQFFYTINTLALTFYQPFTDDHSLVFADKLTFGTILGATHHAIPPSERFYAGSDNLLRGYHYLTVSPLNNHHRPTGGRSMLINSFELRYRMSQTLGMVGFYEAGNVFESNIPNLKEGLLQSVGVGLRYYTPVGPLRADIAFPLNRRKHVDGPFQFYISIGQAF